MVVLGGGRFLMSEVPLYSRPLHIAYGGTRRVRLLTSELPQQLTISLHDHVQGSNTHCPRVVQYG